MQCVMTSQTPMGAGHDYQEHSLINTREGSNASPALEPIIAKARNHQDYLDSLIPPTKEVSNQISRVQEHKEEETIMRRVGEEHGELSEEERREAAEIIQRNYRGHRERRMLNGMSLDPSTRWVEAVREAQYRNLTTPRSRANTGAKKPNELEGEHDEKHVSMAKHNWKKIGTIARRAGGDEDSDDSSSDEDDKSPREDQETRRQRRAEKNKERQKAAKTMDLQYFLEMVDLKHRYGSNLRTYHAEWKSSDTNENFFYWLDYGEGRLLNCQGCSRERLDKEQVRYLSKEERMDYLVKIDKDGRLCWAKNGARIDTTEKFKDSIHGIVPDTDETPAYAPADAEAATGLQDGSSERSSTSTESGEQNDEGNDDEAARANKYTTPEFDNAKGVKKVRHVSATTIFNKLLRGSVKKNTWIFVADTSFRLYVGIKQSGAFQHSSFLHGSRISAAGLIKVKNGRLTKLSPLSGHYRPPVSNFRAFIHSLKDEGVDMSHVSISRSYAVLVGLEAYVKTRRRGKKMIKKLVHHRDKLISPEEVAKREEEERDKSESAAIEQRFLETKQQAEEEDRERNRANLKLLERLHITPKTPVHENREREEEADIEAVGTGPENSIAPEGTRNT